MTIVTIGDVPIAELHPNIPSRDERTVSGVVTLIWPYASSTETLTLLLVEHDFRLRARHGQARITFNGSSARAILRAGISSCDRVTLSLKGAEFSIDESTTSTPGKGIKWGLHYGEYLEGEVCEQDHCKGAY